MGVFERLGARAIINVAGPSTRLGGALMPPEVVQAMSEAALDSVSMTELQAAASRTISDVTGAEAGYVTAGASSALTLGMAAIIAGFDLGKMERLPDTSGMKNEVIISKEQRTGYDHAIRLAGARLVEVGMNEAAAGAGVRHTEIWEYDAAVTPQTVAIFYVADPGARPSLSDVVKVARKRGLPVLVDAAGELPPISNLRAFTALGADLVAFSGGKALRGPQSTGILCGRKDLIASAALQHLDMDEHFELWEPPQDFIPKSKLAGLPRHGIGRGFKVAKEEIAGVLTALLLFADGKIGANLEEQRGFLEYLADGLSGLPVEPRIFTDDTSGQPVMHLVLLSDVLGKTGFDVCRELRTASPGVFPGEALLSQDTLVISAFNLDQRRAEMLTVQLREVLS
jgi:D-glucosaminate-6-phosphate ammonia-lyase